MELVAAAQALVPGTAAGVVMKCDPPLSFWGGVHPLSGRIIAADHPLRGQSLAGRILVMACSIGSSSGSSVLLQLAANHTAPAAIILGHRDAILTLGALVAAEMGYGVIPVLLLGPAGFDSLPETVRIDCRGRIFRPDSSEYHEGEF